MVLYFDVIPEELNYIIISKIDVDLYDDLYKINIFKSILDKGYFWSNLLKGSTKDINYNLIPNYLYNYNDNEYNTNLYTYINLIDAYNIVKERINSYNSEKEFLSHYEDTTKYDNFQMTWTYDMRGINNFDILNLKYTKRINNDIEEKIRKLLMTRFKLNKIYQLFEISFSLRMRGHVFILQVRGNQIEYEVSLQDMFNAMLHVILNGGII
jgi:hypothetical protein